MWRAQPPGRSSFHRSLCGGWISCSPHSCSANDSRKKTTMQRKSLDIWVGLFVILGAAALMFLALKAGNMSSLSFGQTYPVVTKFDNIGGLKPQAPVKSA